MNILRRKLPAEKINETLVQRGIMLFAILLARSAIVLNAPVLSFTSICSPIFGMVGCLIPAAGLQSSCTAQIQRGVAVSDYRHRFAAVRISVLAFS